MQLMLIGENTIFCAIKYIPSKKCNIEKYMVFRIKKSKANVYILLLRFIECLTIKASPFLTILKNL